MSDSETGPFSLIHQITDKTITQHVIEDLPADSDYYFQLKTFTNPHYYNPNFVVSEAINPVGVVSSDIQFPMQSVHSGSWYNPEQSGHGLAFEVLPNNIGLVYWYVYDNQGNQMWLIGTGPYDGKSFQADMTILNGAMFPPDFNSNDLEQNLWGTINIEFTGDKSMSYSWIPRNDSVFDAGQMNMQQISRMHTENENTNEGSTDQISMSHSGSWYNPMQSGHGLAVEILPNYLGLIYWYVYDEEGNQVWLLGSGTYEGSQLNLDMTHVTGGMFPPAFNSDDLTLTHWGTATLTLDNCNNGTFAWHPDETQTTFTSGQMSIQRITQLAGLECVE